MSQYVVAAIEAYNNQLSAINSAVNNKSLTHDEANLKITEINTILAILQDVLNSAGDNKLLDNITLEVENNSNLTDENINYLINVIKLSRQIEKPNFFYNELLAKMVSERIPEESQLTLDQIVNELISIYTDLQKYYDQYKDIFRFTTNVQNSFNSKISGLKEIIKHNNRGSLTRDLCKTFIDGRLEPIVFDLITPKLRREQYEGFKAIDRTGLYIEIYSFPPEYNELKADYEQRIKEAYSEDSPIKFEQHQPLVNSSTPSKTNSYSSVQPVNNKQQSQQSEMKKLAQVEQEIPLNLKQLNVITSKLDSLSQLIETLTVSNKASVSANQKILEIINNLGNDEEHYLAQLSNELSKHLSNIFQKLEDNKAEFSQLLSKFNTSLSESTDNNLVNVIADLNNKLVSISKTSENLNNITSFLNELKSNITNSYSDSITSLTNLIQNAVKENLSSEIISKQILEMIHFSNNSATEKIAQASEIIKTNFDNSIAEYTKKATAIEDKISGFERSMAESFITGSEKINNAIAEFKTEIGRQQKNSDLDKYKTIVNEAKLEIDAAKSELTGSNNDLKNFINDKFLTRLSDLQKTVNTNSGFLDANNRNNTYRKGYFWSVATTLFSVLIFISVLTLIYTIKSTANDSIEYHRILNKLDSIDTKNQAAIKQVLNIE